MFSFLLTDEVGKMIKAKNSSEGKKKPRVNITTRKPFRKQVIIPMAKSNTELIINSANHYISNVNKYLKNIKSDVVADFICSTNYRLIITMNKLANASNLNTIEKYLKNIQNIKSDSINCLYLPKSKLYLKIIRLPHVMEQDIISSDIIKGILKKLYLFKDIILVLKLCIIKVSPKSDIVVIWVDIWDFQSGFITKNIINC